MENDQREILGRQLQHWEKTYATNPTMFGDGASEPARRAATLFKQNGVANLLELGGGQGRDTLYLARHGFTVTSLDYTAEGVLAIAGNARRAGVGQAVTAVRHDVRRPLPFPDAAFDACYSHMLMCMALSTAELEALAAEIRRVLKSGGLHVYTVRHVGDPHYGAGIPRGEDLYEVGGFIVHFFTREKVEHLARGFRLVGVEPFEEGALPRKLFYVTLQKEPSAHFTEKILDAPLDEPVCWCSNISKQAILGAIHAGANSLEDIRRETGACTLGRCRELSPRGRCCSKDIKLLLEAANHDKERSP